MSFLLVLVFFFYIPSCVGRVCCWFCVCQKPRWGLSSSSQLLWNVLPIFIFITSDEHFTGFPFLVFLFTTSQVELRSFCVMQQLLSPRKKGAKGGSKQEQQYTFIIPKKRSRKKTVSQTSRARSCPPPNSWLMVWLGERILGRIVVALFGWRTGVLYHCHLRLQSLLCIFQQPPTLSFYSYSSLSLEAYGIIFIHFLSYEGYHVFLLYCR